MTYQKGIILIHNWYTLQSVSITFILYKLTRYHRKEYQLITLWGLYLIALHMAICGTPIVDAAQYHL